MTALLNMSLITTRTDNIMSDYSRKTDKELRNAISTLTNQIVIHYQLPNLRKVMELELKELSTEYIQRYN